MAMATFTSCQLMILLACNTSYLQPIEPCVMLFDFPKYDFAAWTVHLDICFVYWTYPHFSG